jgi:hypothetical protein
MTDPLVLIILGGLVAFVALYRILKRIDRDFPPWEVRHEK